MSRSKKRNDKKIISSLITLMIIIIFALLEYNLQAQNKDYKNTQEANVEINNTISEEKINGELEIEDGLKVYFIDVGQADSILITRKRRSNVN